MQARALVGIASALCVVLAANSPASAAIASAPDQGLQNIGEGVAIALPLVAGGISLYKHDWNGAGQLVLSTRAALATSYLLSHVVKEERPYCKGEIGCDDRAFPSDTSALAFAPAQYLWNRYGWEYGVPAYAAAIYTGYSGVEAKEHHWYDVAASAGFAFGFSKIFTTRYHPPGLIYGAEVSPRGSS